MLYIYIYESYTRPPRHYVFRSPFLRTMNLFIPLPPLSLAYITPQKALDETSSLTLDRQLILFVSGN
jgi:hypothetical protein